MVVSAWCSHAIAAPRDPTVPTPVVVGRPDGAAPMDGQNGERTGQSRFALPTNPILGRRARLAGDLLVPAVVDAQGRLFAATANGVAAQLSGEGRVEWTRELPARVVLAPVLTGDGTRVVVTEQNDVIGLSPDGSVVFREHVDAPLGLARPAPLASRDGGVVLGASTRVLRLDARGALQSWAELNAPLAALLEGRHVVAVTEDGGVYVWDAPARPKIVGQLGKASAASVLLSTPDTLLATRDSAMVELNLATGIASVIATVAPDLFAGPLALVENGELRSVTRHGMVLGHSGSRETVRWLLPSAGTNAGVPGVPRLVVDRSGTTAVGLPGALAVVPQSGDGHVLGLPGCAVPVGVWPVRALVAVVGCRNGALFWIGEGRAPPRNAPPKP